MNKSKNVPQLSVAIIGSGPSGLASAERLNSKGYKITVFDELKEFGGMIAYGIPSFRIPLELSQKRARELGEAGISFERKRIVSVKPLLKENGGKFDFVVLAIGAGSGTKVGFVGEESSCVIDALNYLSAEKLEGKKIVSKGEKVAVIGGGNAAIDAARSAARSGASVKIIYRRTENEMPALKNEIESAKKEGVLFGFLLAPKSFDNKSKKLVCSKLVLGDKDSSGRPRPVETGKVESFDFDKIITAVGQKNDYSWLEKEGIKTDGKIIIVDKDCLTSLTHVYACGDCVTGPKTIGEAVKTGLRVAEALVSASK